MGLYNFQHPRFVRAIEAGTKTHTIRPHRVRPDKPGNIVYLYTGLRHPGARLIMRGVCTRIESIRVTSDGEVFVAGWRLDPDERERLARADGFESWSEMYEHWRELLPFDGQIVHWRRA